MYHYSTPPPGWSSHYMTSPPTSPHYAYYATQVANPYGSPRPSSKRHGRKASYAGTKEAAGWQYAGYGTPFYDAMPEYSTPPRKHENATEEDAAKAGIPAGYSIKNWDPTETPIILLGSVFDANSLGKWIYDWTVFHHGASTPMADVAGELWLLLIKLAGKIKRADECVDRIKQPEHQEVVEDFLESGERLWARFKKLLKTCEQFMWKAAKREGGKSVSMGRNAGCEFVETIFGRDRELESTEKLMNSVRLWNMRFDANCEEILRRPAA
ncbi:vegetative cell wall protein gp1 [Aspergillus nomiae NRRL 13137]|uniref:Vegetative cell wall protein gp1 n=1 Tax=Aspergillus nomiae NRRL (strain ATCC 15546 / NRRL 13137 / CBS 260.88 / M93) TaxID=1509407 RepID=A0A0L1J4U4_ASPN3|nr:vegetative cell wall protein gp1 [Aspergillus nomiae NRRL 13137]KNG86705.1 vegetative cell wall protein gp1 [Aspergillus nomiae NRRL 13137]